MSANPLEDENFALAANQCHDGYGDEWGNHRCRAIDRAVSECEFLAQRATDLVEVLKPFANFYERHFKLTWQDHESHWTNFDGLTVGDLRRARAALAAEPASGGRDPYTRTTSNVFSPAPTPPPTQGEEETARHVRDQLCHEARDICRFDMGCGCLDAIIAALRQCADEATRAENETCALRLDEEAKRHEDAMGPADDGEEEYTMHLVAATNFRSIAAAIRARVAKVEP